MLYDEDYAFTWLQTLELNERSTIDRPKRENIHKVR